LSKEWDISEYNKIRAVFEQDPVRGLGTVNQMCRNYHNSGIPGKRFSGITSSYCKWYESLKTRRKYNVRVALVRVNKSDFTDGKRRNREISVFVAIQNSRHDTSQEKLKKTDSQGAAYDLGTFQVPWQLGDPITVGVKCYNMSDEEIKTSVRGRGTLAFLAGMQTVAIGKKAEVRFELEDKDAWFVFPIAEDIL
jgi:hypothetical protein